MDGNNRWAKKNKLSKYDAYKAGADNLIKLSEHLFSSYEIKYISSFALSTNNLKRSKSILNPIFKVLKNYLNEIEQKQYQFRFDINFIGNFEFLETEIKNKIISLNKNNKFNKKLVLYINYGGREDIESASINFSKLNSQFTRHLLTNNLPDPDLLIRTGGFSRISNFFLYQIAFTELFFIKKLWPDLKKADINKIILKYRNTERKFGK